MDAQSKLSMIKTALGIAPADVSIDGDLYTYLDMAGIEILNWMYINHPTERESVTEVPLRYEITQINAVVNGYSHRGAEGEKVHNENGINRQFVYGDMVDYIRSNVFQLI